MVSKKREKKDKTLLIQRNYLMHIAKQMLNMSNAEIADVFNCERQTVTTVMKNGKEH